MAHPKSEELKKKMEKFDPFEHMNICDTRILDEIEERSPCSVCGKSRKYFCYTCYVPIEQLSGLLPKIKLPIKVDIIKHKNETDGKSTACHAALLAPEDVTTYTYPDIPDYTSEENVVLIFPSAKARTIRQIFHSSEGRDDGSKSKNRGTLMKELSDNIRNSYNCKLDSVTELPVKRAVFIDSTWNQSRGIYKDERVKKLPCLVIHNRISQFWRHQKGSPRWYLATIEAIHQFLVEMHLIVWGIDANYMGLKNCLSEEYIEKYRVSCQMHNSYNGQYDNLLFFFKYMYNLIHSYYEHEQLYAYKRRLL